MAQRGFPEYCCIVDPSYQLEWFHEKIALKLEESVKRVESGEDVRLMIFMPPRHGKSDQATQKFPSWVLGNHPEWPFIVASYSQELATDFGQGTRDLMDSSNYKNIFNTRLRADTQAKAKWMTNEGGGYTAVGVGGSITGRGFKVGIVDDPFKNREDADSVTIRESVHKWWRSTFYTRQEGNSLIVLILTRWHDDDLAGRLLKEQREAEKLGEENYDKWEVLEFKALAEADEDNRKKGEALWPNKFSVNKLLKTKASLGGYEFSALYQQNPIDEENQEFKREWLQYIPEDEVLRMRTRKSATIDSALSKGAKSDFTGVTRNYVNDVGDWHIKTQRYKISSKELIDLIFTLHTEGMETIGIEEGAYLSAVEPFLKAEMSSRNVYPNVVVLKHGGTMKETRIRGLIPRYENKKIYHIAGYCADVEEEYFRFPKSAHDDCLDSLAYQNQVATPPNGERVAMSDMTGVLTPVVNSQEEPVIIGISTSYPVSLVVGNKYGLFYNSKPASPLLEIDALIKKWDKVFVVMDALGDTSLVQTIKDKHKNVFISYYRGDVSSQNLIKWGDSNEYGTVHIAKNQTLQQIIEEIKAKSLEFSGTYEDWEQVIQQFINLYKITEPESYSWESSGPDGFVKALINFRVGLDRFSSTSATVVSSGGLDSLPVGRIFIDD